MEGRKECSLLSVHHHLGRKDVHTKTTRNILELVVDGTVLGASFVRDVLEPFIVHGHKSGKHDYILNFLELERVKMGAGRALQGVKYAIRRETLDSWVFVRFVIPPATPKSKLGPIGHERVFHSLEEAKQSITSQP